MNLLDRLMQFRKREIALTADIEKAFLQIKIKEEDQDWLRFLWKKDGKLQIFKMTSVPFGITTAPAILEQSIQTQLNKYKNIYQETVTLLQNSFYMDDLITSFDTVPEAIQAKKEAITILSAANFNLRKWNTNSLKLEQTSKDFLQDSLTKILGVVWEKATDVLKLHIALPTIEKLTKRTALKLTNSLFDPLGIVEPVRLKLKLILQKLWQSPTSWDSPITSKNETEFRTFQQTSNQLSSIQIPRRYLRSKLAMINIFCDASQESYGFVVFVTSEKGENTFVQGKSRVAPNKGKGKNDKLKPISNRTIPELELTALTEATETTPYFCKLFPNIPILLWSDSEITLKRIQHPTCNRPPYVENRITRIHQICKTVTNLTFLKVSTNDNPADNYSRPLTIDEFLKRQPHICNKNLIELSKSATIYQIPSQINTAPILARPASPTSSASGNSSSISKSRPIVEIPGFEHCNNWTSLVNEVKLHLQQTLNQVDSPETTDALLYIYRIVQESCAEEMNKLDQYKRPYAKDEKGIIRFKNRLPNEPNPIWIPQNSRLSSIIIDHQHQKIHHKGKRFTKAIISLNYFIPKLDSKVHNHIKHCIECQRKRKALLKQPTGMLPKWRTIPYGPWECVGLDYFGPMMLPKESKKYYGLLYTCCFSRAIDVELVDNLSASSCLSVLNLLFNRYGLPKIILSDNGTNLTKCKKDLKKLIQVTKNNIEGSLWSFKWKFIPPHTPRWGGLYERLIGELKRSLSKLNNCQNYFELRCIMSEAINIVNSRPLMYDDDAIVTPAHYTIGRNLQTLPSGYGAGSIESLKAYRRIKRERKRFINLWRPLYLQTLATQGLSNNSKHYSLKIGDYVIVKEPNKSREDWMIAKILNVFPGPDGIIRKVEIIYTGDDKHNTQKKSKIKSNSFIRTVENLILLEVLPNAPPEYVMTVSHSL